MENRVYYPLAPAQHLVFLQRKYAVHKSILNIPTSLILDVKLDNNLLQKALEIAISRWDSFGLRLKEEDKDVKQYFDARSCECLEQKDFSKSTEEKMLEFFNKEAQKKMGIMECPMARFFILTTPKGTTGVFSVINHIMMDSWSISMFYKDVMDVYNSLNNNLPLPKEVKSYESCLIKEIEYRNSESYKNDQEFWVKEIGQVEPIYTSVNGAEVLEKYRKKTKNNEARFSNSFFIRTKAEHVVRTIDKEAMDKMKTFLKDHEFPSMQILFLMGLRTYLAKVNKTSDVGINSIVARRATLEDKLSGGTRAHFLPFRTIIDEDRTFLEALDILLDKQNSVYRHANINPMELFGMEEKVFPKKPGQSYRGVTLTFQPVSMEVGNGIHAKTEWYPNGSSAQPFYLTIMDGDGTGGLKCYYEYIINHVKPETINACHDYMVKVILEGISQPEMKVGELYHL